MTAAQKIAKEKFKKAIAYRKISGCTLKEAFAKIYNKKTAPIKKAASNVKKLVDKAKKAYKEGYDEAAKEIARKKAAKKVGAVKKKKAAPKKVLQKTKPRYSATKHKNWATIPAHKRRVNGMENHKDTKSHNVNIKVVSGISNAKKSQNQEIIKKYNDTINEIAKQEKYLENWYFALKSNKGFPANIQIIKKRISEIKKLISELKIHSKQLKKYF
jgi:hypothetical protein